MLINVENITTYHWHEISASWMTESSTKLAVMYCMIWILCFKTGRAPINCSK